MPAPETFERRQAAVLWAATGVDAYGVPSVTPYNPIEIRVRWVGSSSEMLDPNGNVISVDSTAKVDRDIAIGSLMWLGGLEDLSGTSGAPPEDCMYVKAQNFTKDMKIRWTHRTVGLMRRRGLPTT